MKTRIWAVLVLGVSTLSGSAVCQTQQERMRQLHQGIESGPGSSPHEFGLSGLAFSITGTELLSDGGFESGWAPSGDSGSSGVSGPWVWSQTGSVLNPIWWDNNPGLSSPGSASRTGSWCVYFNPFGPSTNRIYQSVTIPSGAHATLSFWLKIGTLETTSVYAYDTLMVSLRNSSGGLLTTLHTYSNLDASAGYTYIQHSVDVSAYAGSTVRVQFDSSEDSTKSTVFLLDDVSLVATSTGSGCTEDALTMCLIGGRYRVTSQWKNQYAGGVVSNLSKSKLTDATGAFWLSDSNSHEYLIRISTATTNGRAWIAIPTFTDVEFWITVQDTVNGQSYTYHSPPGNRTLIYDPYFFIFP